MRIRVIFRSFQHRAAHLSLEVYFATSFFQFKLTPEDQKIRGIKFSHWWWSMKQPMSKFQRQRATQIHGNNTVTMIPGARIMMAGKTGASQLPSSSDGALFCDCGSFICTSLPLDYESLTKQLDILLGVFSAVPKPVGPLVREACSQSYPCHKAPPAIHFSEGGRHRVN